MDTRERRFHITGGGSQTRTESSDDDTERDESDSPSERSRRHFRGRPNGHTRYHNEERDMSNSYDSVEETASPVPYWSAKRHLTCGNPSPGPPWSSNTIPWRGSAPGKLKTVNAALVLCLNIDVDPPDVVKTNPCAVLECWVDPHTMPSHKALEAIGSNLQHQFEGLSLKMTYKPVLDPSMDDLKKFCVGLRKISKDDAILFYYNGHGVPKPTPSGELWCFNQKYTQYIPVSLQEVQNWMGSPGVYIWDCSAAGNLLNNFNIFAQRRDNEVNLMHGGYPDGAQPMMNSLQLAACGANETLPSCPQLPADIFTACLTSPLDVALRYFVMNHQLPNNINADMVVQLPGDLKDRRTPLGELNWIFTAVTDTIAWTTFSRETFTRLYRCDLLIASLFRNFLLAERIMKNYHCTPHTYPPLPATNTHPLWATWDLALDRCLRQLPDLLALSPGIPAVVPAPVPAGPVPNVATTPITPGRIGSLTKASEAQGDKAKGDKPYVYEPSTFFTDQLTAFEVWISRGGSALTKKGPLSLPQHGAETSTEGGMGVNDPNANEAHLVPRKPPDQLPIVLQVLLSQPHRLRALILLSQFVDLGPWAVHLVLTIGIFPYISKLLQAAGPDLRPVLIFIWARILAVDPTVQMDLYNTGGYRYFAHVLSIQEEDGLPNSSEHKAMCSFILAAICRDLPLGQTAVVTEDVFAFCNMALEAHDFLLRQWSALCIAQMWDANDDHKIHGVDRGTQDRLVAMLSDDSVEVRCAVLYALGTFLGASGSSDPRKRGGGGSGNMLVIDERTHFRMEVAIVTGATLAIKEDASPMCRKELLVVISCLVNEWRGFFVVCAWLYWEEDRRWRSGNWAHHHAANAGATSFTADEMTNQAVAEWLANFGSNDGLREENRVLLSSIFTIFVLLLDLSVDPYQEVATNAQTIVDYIIALLLESPFARLDTSTLNKPPTVPADREKDRDIGKVASPKLGGSHRTRVASLQTTPSFAFTASSPTTTVDRPGLTRNDSITSTLTNSVSNTIKRTSSFANALKVLTSNIAFPSTSSDDGRSASPTVANAPAYGQSRLDLHKPMDISRPPSPNMNLATYTSPYYSEYDDKDGTASEAAPTRPSTRPSSPASERPPVDFVPSDVIEALVEEDMERLRARRKGSRRHHSHHNGPLPSPSNSTFSMNSDASSVILGIGTGAGIRDVLPLKSSFYDWCTEYFREPQMRQMEADEPGSVAYNYQVWRQHRNDEVTRDTEAQAPIAETTRWDRAVTTWNVQGHPLTMKFHSYDKHLIIGNEHDMVTVWDWSTRKRLNMFFNGNPRGTSITSLEIINQDVGGIIMVGSSDGIVRMYRNYDPTLEQGPLQMVTSFRALNEMVQMRQGTGLVMDWKQTSGTILVGGDARVIKMWDAQTETQGLDLQTNSESPVTAISSDNGQGQIFAASFADGVVKVFDRRMEEEDSIVRTYADHTTWVQNVCWHPSQSGQFISAGLDGQVKLFDIRGPTTASEAWSMQPSGMSAFDIHPVAGCFGSNSAITPVHWRSQRVVVHSMLRNTVLSSFNISSGLSVPPVRGLPSPYIPRASSFAFHPTQMLYANGGADGCVRILGCALSS
ncbi:hypothetical protein D9619_002557 [Psilocybe cf. subviscida]|uniref:Raptor N-terminal CASPase-like domain-containing protein n=1 Tax=Psilocybe cf. subviscida TaxID=2480587 RepID=A0A8H5EUW1_9AGAR|nr:hypothetical protein D9619_002557 [Psilocybe cf. subviscida]